MRDLFPGWIPPDHETLEEYWREGTFAVDTSVLLDLYRFSEEARSGLLKALRSFEDRLWIPHQVALEFHRNRFGVLLDQREAEGKLLGELNQIQADLDKQLSQRLQGAGRRDLAPLREAVDGGFERLREKLQEAEKAHTKGLGASMQDDPIYDEVVELCTDRVGAPFDSERLEEVIADAKERFENEIPPGYLDAGKDERTRYGDVILWHQLREKARESGKPIVLIADDQKVDWVWEVRGKALGPRPELVAEMRHTAEVGFHLYTPKRLLQVWEEREEGRQVEPDVLDEIERPSPTEKSAAPGSFLMSTLANYLSRDPNSELDALGTYNLEGQRSEARELRPAHKVLEGSVVLALSFKQDFKSELKPNVAVFVTSPGGETTAASVPTLGLGNGSERQVLIRYPDDFNGAPALGSGNHAVQWQVSSMGILSFLNPAIPLGRRLRTRLWSRESRTLSAG